MSVDLGSGVCACLQPTVLDNLVGSMKYVLTGMGILHINLENPKNKVLDCRWGSSLGLSGGHCWTAVACANRFVHVLLPVHGCAWLSCAENSGVIKPWPAISSHRGRV